MLRCVVYGRHRLRRCVRRRTLLRVLACLNALMLLFGFHAYRIHRDSGGLCVPNLNCSVALLTDALGRWLYTLTFGLLGGCTQHTGMCSWWDLLGRDMPACERAHFREMLDAVKDAFAQEGLQWWLISGTLLGPLRHADFIPWDYDVDVCVYVPLDKQAETLRAWDRAMQWMVETKGFVSKGRGAIRYSRRNWNHLDFFDCRESGQDGWQHHWVVDKRIGLEAERALYDNAAGRRDFGPGSKLMHSVDSASAVNTPRDIFFPTRMCLLDGSTYPCPHDPVRALLTDFTNSHWVQAREYKLEKLVYPHYGHCLNGCPRRDKAADLENVKRAVCQLHQGGWPSLHAQLVNEFGADVCAPWAGEKATAWREEAREAPAAKITDEADEADADNAPPRLRHHQG